MPYKDKWAGSADFRYRLRYETLRSLLKRNNRALQLLSDLEADLNHLRYSSEPVRRQVARLFEDTLLMAQECNLLTDDRQNELFDVLFKIMTHANALFSREPVNVESALVIDLGEEAALDAILAGNKASGIASLARLFGDNAPIGFVATTAAYNRLLEENGLNDKIRLLLKDYDLLCDQPRYRKLTMTVREWIQKTTIPGELRLAIQQHAAGTSGVGPTGWAVRSSAVFEGDGNSSFAGLFKSELRVAPEHLLSAYLNVVASRFLDRALFYRIQRGIREVESPMAVLFMPMVEPSVSGVIYTTDPSDPSSERMILNAVPGLCNRLAQGKERGHAIRLTRTAEPTIVDRVPASGEQGSIDPLDFLPEKLAVAIAARALRVSGRAGYDLDIEWAVDENGGIHFLQGRRLTPVTSKVGKSPRGRKDFPLIEDGITVFPGRAEGPVCRLNTGDDLKLVPKGSVVLVDQPSPEFTPILPRIAALLAVEGNPVDHLATLAREFSVPSLFRIGDTARRLVQGDVVSVDATMRAIYEGSRWPEMRERVLARISAGGKSPRSGPLYDLVLVLNLTDPDAPGFKPRHCRSIHDVLRYIHEMSIRSMFSFGDEQQRKWHRRSFKLATKVPMKFKVVSLDTSIDPSIVRLKPEVIESTPFKAFWRGFSDAKLPWSDRWKKEMMGLPRDFQEAVLGGHRGPRRASDTNYIMVADDYLNFNARFAYHYSMVDAIVGSGTENNHLFFSFRSGGASDENLARRARFLERVLRQLHFEVDCRRDVVTAWLRRYPRSECENLLATLGRLMVCARQLDMVLKSEQSVRTYATHFLEEKYGIFS
ncbi:MAG: pyruvate, water dikinase [Planctomycetes bacterium]|nr:pyruvate, water dikinase [Planctomycetota bacterium]